MATVNPLEVAAFDFRFRARQLMRMPGYMGSAWRGGFGRTLRRAVCVTGLSTCPGCHFEASCVYPYPFETAPGGEGGLLAGYDRVPNPFVLAPAWDGGRLVPEGGEAGLRLTLIGRAVEHAGFAKQALVEAGLRGLGPDRGVLDLASVEKVTPPLSRGGRERARLALGPAALRPGHLLLPLLRRVSTLAERHGPAPLELDFRAQKERAEVAEFEENAVRWAEWARYSGRQRALLQMGGLLGLLSLPLAGIEPLWPFLALAPWVHVGKGTTMGLGAMRVTAG
jgi:hypothetical protein